MTPGLKLAFIDGAQDALAHYGLAPKREKSTLRKALPWLAAGAAGVGGYALLRKPTFSANPALRKIQERASSKGFHRIIDVTPDGSGGRLRPVANTEGKLSPWNKLKMFLNEGTSEAIPVVHSDDGRARIVGHRGPKRVEGVVHGRQERDGRAQAVRGGVDIEGTRQQQQTLHRLSRGGKRREGNLLSKYAPDAIPETFTDMSQLFEGLPADRQQAMKELQSRVLSNHGNDILLKPTKGLASGGKFPRSSQDWATHLHAYDTHMADPANRKALAAVEAEGGNEVSQYLKTHGLYEGQTLHHALRDPKSVIGQRLVPNGKGEWRVHTIAGSAPTNMMFPRFSKGPGAIAGTLSKDKNMSKFVEETLAKLPPKYREGNYAFDVMPHKKPDGTMGYKIIEMNPTEHVTKTDSGGGSGFLDPSLVPMTGHAHYRAATGRSTPLIAGLGGAGTAGLAGLGVRALTDDE